MKKLLVLLVTVLALNLSSAQTEKTINTVSVLDTYFTHQTDKAGVVDVNLMYSTTKEGKNMSDSELRTVLVWANSVTQSMMKSRRSYIPFTFVVKYKWNKKGNHKYAIHVSYAGTNSYGGEVEGFQMYELNKKFKETFGSIMLRS